MRNHLKILMLEAPTPIQTRTRSFTWRKTTEADLAACLEVQPVHVGDQLTGPEIARKVWRRMLADPAMVTAVFECEPPIEGRRIAGFGAAAFVGAEFADAELANPRPHINARVIESLYAGRPVLLTPGEIARANAGNGLDMVNLCGSMMESILSPEERGQVQTLLSLSLAQLLAGYRLNRIFGQATDVEMRAMLGSNLVREVASFPELKLANYVATQQVALAQPFSIQVTIFNNREPLLRLSGADQELLWAALEGQTDAGLAVSLHLTMPAVKARWRSIFARFARLKPAVAPEFHGAGSRGPQKRHRVLAYLREHPEELRAFAPDAGGDRV
jgi:hypothetical protein